MDPRKFLFSKTYLFFLLLFVSVFFFFFFHALPSVLSVFVLICYVCISTSSLSYNASYLMFFLVYIFCWGATMPLLSLGMTHPNDDFQNRLERCDVKCRKWCNLLSLNINWFSDEMVKTRSNIVLEPKVMGLIHECAMLGEGLLGYNNATLKPRDGSLK